MNGVIPNWAKLVLSIGFPSVVALYFMAREVGFLDTPDKRTAETLTAHAAAQVEHGKKQDELVGRITTGLKVMCENNALSKAALNNCQNIR